MLSDSENDESGNSTHRSWLFLSHRSCGVVLQVVDQITIGLLSERLLQIVLLPSDVTSTI